MSDAESVISQEKSDELDIDDMAEIKNYFYENTIVSHLLNWFIINSLCISRV